MSEMILYLSRDNSLIDNSPSLSCRSIFQDMVKYMRNLLCSEIIYPFHRAGLHGHVGH